MLQLALPARHDRLPRCMRCGYDLTGVAVDAPCPECGASTGPFWVLTGVPQSLGGSAQRRIARGVLIAGSFVSSQVVLLLMFVHWSLALAAFVACGGLALWLFMSSPRERGGAERFVIGVTGIARMATKNEAVRIGDEAFVTFAPHAQLQIAAVGTQWIKFRVISSTGSKQFEAGARCELSQLGMMTQDLQAMLATAGVMVAVMPRPW